VSRPSNSSLSGWSPIMMPEAVPSRTDRHRGHRHPAAIALDWTPPPAPPDRRAVRDGASRDPAACQRSRGALGPSSLRCGGRQGADAPPPLRCGPSGDGLPRCGSDAPTRRRHAVAAFTTTSPLRSGKLSTSFRGSGDHAPPPPLQPWWFHRTRPDLCPSPEPETNWRLVRQHLSLEWDGMRERMCF
jgi:hypothetical protein